MASCSWWYALDNDESLHLNFHSITYLSACVFETKGSQNVLIQPTTCAIPHPRMMRPPEEFMNAYLAIKYHPDNKNRPLIEQLTQILERSGVQSTCTMRDLENWGQIHFPPDELMQKCFEIIDTSDLVVVELSEKGVGIGIEAGYAWARGIPIFTIARVGCEISSTLVGISQSVCHYDTPADLAAYFAKIRAAIRPPI